METLCYRVINDSFTVPGLCSVESVMLYNNGMSFITVEESPTVKAGYGIRLRYLDERGVRRCVNGSGSIMFFGIEEDCSLLTVSTGSEISTEVCGNFVRVRAKIALCTNAENVCDNNEENLLTN